MLKDEQNFRALKSIIHRGFLVPEGLAKLGIGLVLTTTACNKKAAQVESSAPKAQAVHVAYAQNRDLAERVDYVGTVFSAREIKIRAQLAGSLAELPRKEGESARAGDILALIDAPDLRERKKRFSAEVQKARNESAYFCKSLRDNKKLYKAARSQH